MEELTNKIKEKKIKQVFNQYEIYKIKLKYLNNLDGINNEQITKMKNFVNYIEELLSILDDNIYRFLHNVYIEKLSVYDMPISRSNFYYKKRKYNDILYTYLF